MAWQLEGVKCNIQHNYVKTSTVKMSYKKGGKVLCRPIT